MVVLYIFTTSEAGRHVLVRKENSVGQRLRVWAGEHTFTHCVVFELCRKKADSPKCHCIIHTVCQHYSVLSITHGCLPLTTLHNMTEFGWSGVVNHLHAFNVNPNCGEGERERVKEGRERLNKQTLQ